MDGNVCCSDIVQSEKYWKLFDLMTVHLPSPAGWHNWFGVRNRDITVATIWSKCIFVHSSAKLIPISLFFALDNPIAKMHVGKHVKAYLVLSPQSWLENVTNKAEKQNLPSSTSKSHLITQSIKLAWFLKILKYKNGWLLVLSIKISTTFSSELQSSWILDITMSLQSNHLWL